MAIPLQQPATDEPIYYTAEMVDALNAAEPERLPRYECVYGKLFVTASPPRPWHQTVRMRLYHALHHYARGEPAAGYVDLLESKFTFGRPDVNVGPDVWAVRPEEWRAQDWDAITVPLLLAEVLSPSTKRRDRVDKRRAYMEAGVPLYWIVDGDKRWVEVWTPGVHFPHFERGRLVWHPGGAAESFAYAIEELFAPL